jgi:predicted NAD/FAD-binding protein
VSNIGTWMHDVGAGWLMTSLSPSPLMVALVQAATTLPIFLFALPAGALADVVDRRRLLLVGQGTMAVLAGLLALLVWLGRVDTVTLLVFTFLLGACAAFVAPAWQAIVPKLVPREALQPAIALNSVGINISRAIGPALAGFIIVGAGIAGNVAARELHRDHDGTVFEAGRHVGGHTHTHDIEMHGRHWQVDTGFIVFNDRTYPNFIALLDELGVPSQESSMSFSVRDEIANLEYNGTSLNALFAQRRNLLRPAFLGMVRDILRFNSLTTQMAVEGKDAALSEPIGDFLRRQGFSEAFQQGYLLPMVACIWSCPVQQMMAFPMATLVRFCHNHGLLQVANRPQWFTVKGGSREYVRRILRDLPDVRLNNPVHGVAPLGAAGEAGVMVHSRMGSDRFDAVVLACHSDQALAMLGAGATAEETSVLGAIRYHDNEAILHTDTTMLPKRPAAWAAWNYERAADHAQEQAAVCLHYWINRLQPLPWTTPVVVSLNPGRAIDPAQVRGEYHYSHPVFDLAAVAAQRRLPQIQGRSHLWFCGAWARYGFHEDGLGSALDVVQAIQARWAAQAVQEAA